MRALSAAVVFVCALGAVPARALGVPAPPPSESPCSCAAKKKCWKVAMIVYRKRVALSKEEVEGGLPNRFFPATTTFALRRPTEDGHFLSVECGAARIPCTDKRDELERRLILSSLLGSLPLNLPEGTLFDPDTFRVSARGEKTIAELKTCRKTLMQELAEGVLGGGD